MIDFWCMTSQKITNVLAATDFSPAGNNAVMAAIAICKQHNAVLHLLHVAEKKYVVSVAEFGLGAAIIIDDDQEARSQLYNMYERILKEHEIMVRLHMPKGIAHQEISLAAKELSADLVVMGTHAVSGLKDFLAGSAAYSVIKDTHAAVLTVPEGFAGSFKKILFPIRPVKGVIEKFRFIRSLLNPGSQVNIALLYDGRNGSETFDYKNELTEIVTCLGNLAVPYCIDLYPAADPAAKVLELCNSLSADLLVINATLDRHWTRFFTGPYTQQVLNHAAIPVLSFHDSSVSPVGLPLTGKKQDGSTCYYH
jgi:nucleotide-binding universal stress UspA family protein